MSNEIRHIEDIANYVRSGKAIGTLTNERTGGRFTFLFSMPKKERGKASAPVFFSVLTGSNNVEDYEFLGTMSPTATGYVYRPGKKSRISADAQSSKVADWFVRQINAGLVFAGQELPSGVRFQHEGRCGRCGRKLTVPESIDIGLGPECAGKV